MPGKKPTQTSKSNPHLSLVAVPEPKPLIDPATDAELKRLLGEIRSRMKEQSRKKSTDDFDPPSAA